MFKLKKLILANKQTTQITMVTCYEYFSLLQMYIFFIITNVYI